MVELVYNDVVIKIRGSLGGEILGVEGLNGKKQVVNALWPVAAHKQLPEVGVLQNRSEGIQALPQNFLPMGHEKQPAGFAGVLFAKALIVQSGDHCFSGTGGCYHQVTSISSDSTLRLQLVQNLLLVGIGSDVHGVDFGVIGIEVFFRL